jgi:hypothetical protein
VKQSPQNSDKILLKSLTSINKGASSSNQVVTFQHEEEDNLAVENASPKVSTNQIYRSSTHSKPLDDEYEFHQQNQGSANDGSAALLKKFELTGPTIGKNSSEEDIQMIYHGAPERRNELMQSGMVLMQSIAKGDGGDNRTPKQSSMFGHY